MNANRTQGFDYNGRDIYANDRFVNDWGYVGEAYSDGTQSGVPGSIPSKPPFFRDISIYGFNQHKFVEYVLINPLITEWAHDQYDYYQDGGIMENTMTIQYETVKYYSGAIGSARPDTNAQGFANPTYYDQIQSPIGRPGGTQSVLGQGGHGPGHLPRSPERYRGRCDRRCAESRHGLPDIQRQRSTCHRPRRNAPRSATGLDRNLAGCDTQSASGQCWHYHTAAPQCPYLPHTA